MRFLLAILFVSLSFAARADDLDLAKRDGAILLMRHALAPGGGDPAGFRLDDCSTQRNLSEEGREQAHLTGDYLRRAGVEVDLVATSQWCRCRETATLIDLGGVVDWPSLNSFFGNRQSGPAQTRATLEQLSAVQEGSRVLLVTHQVNITALTGVFPKSGEIIVTRLVDGALKVEGRIEPR